MRACKKIVTLWILGFGVGLAPFQVQVVAAAPKPPKLPVPVIVTAPANKTVTAGSLVTFTITATSTTPMSYQWYQNGARVGTGADFYTIASAQPGDSGTYTVKVSNLFGSVTSGAAVLAVTPAPVAPAILTPPVGQVVVEGQPATFTVVASGSGPLHYLWKKNGTCLGSDSATCTLALPSLADVGSSITVTVSNSAGSVTSGAVPLTVNPLVVTLASSMPLELTPIAAGTFAMGGGLTSDTLPVHQVTISCNFYVGTFPVTQAQWQQIMGSNPSLCQPGGGVVETADLRRPVEMVSYTDITAPSAGFLALLNQNATVSPAVPTGYVFRLPTEAEWEYACRAGTTTAYYWGDDPDATLIPNYAWFYSNDGRSTMPAGLLLPNGWGLHDMAGNVFQWCQDWAVSSYDSGPATDPAGPASGEDRVARGGSFHDDRSACRSAYRNGFPPDLRTSNLGFRVVLAPPRVP